MLRWIRRLALISITLIALSGIAGGGIPGALAATDTLDQSQTTIGNLPGDATIHSGQSVAQTFTAGLSGILDRVKVAVTHFGSPPTDLTVSIETTVAGAPSNTVIGGATVPSSDADGSLVNIPLSTQPIITAGTVYAIVLSCSSCTLSSLNIYAAPISDSSTYSRGISYFNGGGESTWVNANNQLAFQTYVTPASPTISTQATTPVIVGGTATDTATLASGAAATGTITFSVYGPSATPDCSGTPVATSTATVNGDGQYTSGNFTPTAVGTYYWIASYGGDTNNNSATTMCGDTNESSVVNQASPTISTQAATPVTVGGSATDTATLSSGYNPTGTITFSVYGPSATPNCTGTPDATSTATVSGNGQYTSGTFTATIPGTYYWIASYGGDTNNDTATTKCGDTNESSVVNAASPTITTAAATPLALGGSATDTATLSSGYSPTGTITFTVYGPSASADCSGTPVATSTATVSGNGQYTSGTFTPAAAGTYYWIASYGGDGNNNTAATKCGDTGETLTVPKLSPTISTQATTPVIVGGTATDTATLPSGSSPTGTITFSVYGPSATPDCSGTPVATSTATVNGDGQYTSGKFTPTAVGTYYWIASYGGDTNNNSATTMCGDTNESSVVNQASPTISTQAATPVTVGGSATDTATLSSGYNPTGTITFSVYGPSATPNCTGTPVATSTATVTGNGQYTSGTFTATVPGTYYWIASYGGDTNNNSAATKCGDTGETLTASKAAPTLTTQATTPVGIGGAATDTATLASAYQPGGTITFRLYGPSATASCSGMPVFTSTVPVSNAQATSAVFHPLVAGSYYWVASYSGDMNNQAASTRCGDGGETLVVSGVASSSIHTYVLAETGPESCPSATGFSLTATASTYNGASPSGALVFTDAVHHLRLIGGRVLVLQATATTADIYGSSQQNGVVVGYHLHLTVTSSAPCGASAQITTSTGYDSGVFAIAGGRILH